MPVRFTSPSLGGQRESFFGAGEWQVGVAYRRLYADQWFVGSQVDESAAPFGQPLFIDIHSFDFSLAYGVTRQASLTLTLPFSYGTHSRFYADQQRHRVEAFGLGDVSLVGNYWMLDPLTHASGNVAVGLGIKAPSGNNEFEDEFFRADGTVGRRVVDQSIQLGDGGWGFLAQLQAYLRLLPRVSGYFFGSYLVSPREMTAVPSPLPGVTLSVPDVYTTRVGVAYAAWPAQGLSLNLGGRIDGIPHQDLVGGDDGFRRPGYTLFLDPGLALRRGASELTFSLPLRLYQDFQQSRIDRENGFRGGGDLADYLIYAGYTRRF